MKAANRLAEGGSCCGPHRSAEACQGLADAGGAECMRLSSEY